MSHLLRCGLVAAGLVTAFAAGFYLKPVPTVPTVAAQPPAHPVTPPPIVDPDVKPATALGTPQAARPEPPDPLDAAGMAMIRKELGIQTTVLDKSAPVPAVLVDAQKTTPVEPPSPMSGPMPRLEPPPAAPVIDHAPIRRPDLPPGTMMRITIRDPAGTVTTVTTSGQVTMELVAPDGQRPGPDAGPMPRELGATPIPDPLRSVLPILLGSPSFFPPVAWARPLNLPEPRVRWAVDTARQFVDTPVAEVESAERFVRRNPLGPPACGDLYPRAMELFMFLRTEDLEDDEGTGVWYVANGVPYTPEEHERVKYLGSGPSEIVQAFFRPSVVRYRQFEETRLFQRQLGLGVEVSNLCSGGRSIVTLLADGNWKPTTATPESCRWEYEPAPTNFWGTPPLGVRLDF